jgi:hypothetical protein
MPDVEPYGLIVFVQLRDVLDFKSDAQVVLVGLGHELMLGGDAGYLNLIEVADAFALSVGHEIEKFVERDGRGELLAREIDLGLAVVIRNNVFIGNQTDEDVLGIIELADVNAATLFVFIGHDSFGIFALHVEHVHGEEFGREHSVGDAIGLLELAFLRVLRIDVVEKSYQRAANGESEIDGNGVTYLLVLVGEIALKLPVVGEGLDAGIFADGQRAVFLYAPYLPF